MRILQSLLIFYQRLIIPSLAISIAMGILGWLLTAEFSMGLIGTAYILTSLLFQYFIYEIRSSREYYYYFNLGLSKPVLWISTLVISSVIVIFVLII
jgi:hypothetical protein